MECQSARTRSSFKVEGQSLQARRHSMFESPSDASDRPESKGPESEGACSSQPSERGSDFQSEAGRSAADDVMSQVIAVNKTLVQQIDALRLRLEIDYKHNQEQRAAILQETDFKIDEKNTELSNIKTEVEDKTETLARLTEDNDQKTKEIDDLQKQIEDLRSDVEDAKTYADDLEAEVTMLQKDKGKLQTGSAYQEKEEEIKGLHREIDYLRKNLSRLEKELNKAKETIASQGGKVRLLENENRNMQLKFKEELNKVSANMRQEIGKMRDVMRSQWREMKELREANQTMQNDIKEIKELLVEKHKAKVNKEISKSVKPPQQTTSVSSKVTMTFKPSFPVLSKDVKRTNVQNKKNRV